jgi:formamidopyrimidine-DNA glycosylase
MGFINTYLSDFDKLVGHEIVSVVSRGNTIKVQLQGGLNLLLAPEYGGSIRYHPSIEDAPKKYTLKLNFNDQTALTVILTGMGIIHALTDTELVGSYVYRRDFSNTAFPIDPTFTPEQFLTSLERKNVNLKTALVGKDAVVVGFGNASFMDILYRAHIHPQRKATELSTPEKKQLFEAIQQMVTERIRLGGKYQFIDFYGKQGQYIPPMGPNRKGSLCQTCGKEITRISFGGGQVYLCLICQK